MGMRLVSVTARLTAGMAVLWLSSGCNQSPLPTSPPTGPQTVKSTPVSLQMTGTIPEAGQQSQFHSTVTYANGTTADVTAESEWQSANFAVISITPTGLATAQRPGPAQLTATFQGVAASQRMLISGPGTYIMFLSEPGDPVGLGEIKGQFFPSEDIAASRPELNRVTMTYTFFPGAHSQGFTGADAGVQAGSLDWEIHFAGPAGLSLTPGTYENALLWPNQSASRPSMRVWIDGRTCDQQSGRFVVDSAVYGPGQSVQKFHATFEQQCPGTSARIRGEVAVNR